MKTGSHLRTTALRALLGFLAPLLALIIWWSWWRTSHLVAEQSRQSLEFQVRLAVSRLSDHLHDTVIDTEDLARNPVVINAIADGPEFSSVLLGPLLRTQGNQEGRSTLVTGSDGRAIWSSVPMATDPLRSRQVAEAIGTGKRSITLQGPLLRIIVPVHYALTGSYEGAVVIEVPLTQAMEQARTGLTAHLRLEGPDGPVVSAKPIVASLDAAEPLDREPVANLHLRAVVSQPLADLQRPVEEQLRDHAIAGMVALLVAAGGSVLVVQRLTRRLVRLAEATHGTGDPARIPDLGQDEVGDLARTLRTLLTDLQAAHRDLEAQVAQRTNQLKDAMVLGRMGAWSFDVSEGLFTFGDEFYAIFATTAGAQGGYRMTPEAYASRFIPEENRAIIASTMAEVMSSRDPGRLWTADHPILRGDGSRGVIAVRFRTVHDATGQIVRLVGVNQDITERKRLEEDLARSRDAAEAANRAKSAFLATMSHEIRTPLNGVIGMANLLEQTRLAEDQRDMVVTITSSGRHLLTVINDILDFSKIEAGRFDLETIPFRPRHSLREALEPFAPAAMAKGLVIDTQVASTVPDLVVGDPGRLRQILTNLVGNAVKFTDAGRVTVTLAGSPTAEDRMALDITVTDTGIGMTPEQQRCLFQPFVQADATITRRFGGSGLGLAICKRLAELMGGSIVVASTPGQGTTFRVRVLLGTTTAGTAKVVTPLPTTSRRARILVVEDNPVNQRVVTLMLKHLGHESVLAMDGREALDLLARERFDAVLMDCQMPVMDGLAATRALRDPATPVLNHRIPVIALTANAMQGDREDCLAAGMDDFLAKPIDATTLAAALGRWLPA